MQIPSDIWPAVANFSFHDVSSLLFLLNPYFVSN